MGPGPSNPDPRVLAAMGANPVGHLDPYFVELMDQTMGALRGVFRTREPSHAADLGHRLRRARDDHDESARAGRQRGRRRRRLFRSAARRDGASRGRRRAHGRSRRRARSSIPRRSTATLEERPAKLVAFVHAETTTGACQPIAPMVDVARRYGALVAIDCVTSLGGLPIDIDALGVDAAGSCSQKCIGAPPGLAPITIGPRAMDAVRARKHKPRRGISTSRCSSSTGARRAATRTRAFHHTAPIAAIYGFHEALRLILEEGLEARWARHQAAHEALVRGLDRLGLSLFPPRGESVRDDQRHQRARGRRRGEGASASARHGRGDGRRAWRARRQGVARRRHGLQRAGAACRALRRRAGGGAAVVSSPSEARGSTVVVAWDRCARFADRRRSVMVVKSASPTSAHQSSSQSPFVVATAERSAPPNSRVGGCTRPTNTAPSKSRARIVGRDPRGSKRVAPVAKNAVSRDASSRDRSMNDARLLGGAMDANDRSAL